MSSQIKKTAKNSAIYAVGTILRRITALVMLPIYTRYLTPEDYGVVELLTMALEITGILIGLRISQVMFRYYILAESEVEKESVVSTVLVTVTLSSLLGALILYLFSEQVTLFIFGNIEYIFEFQMFAFTLVTNAVTAVGMSYLRARQMPVTFVVVGAVTLALQVASNILFVVIYEMHVTGVVYSALISGILLSFGLTLFIIKNVGLTYSKAIAGKLIAFVAPLILASIGAFYVSYADKYFIRLFNGLTDVGLYALAARLASILATVFEAFNMSWGADRFEVVKKVNARIIFEQVFRFMSAGIVLAGSGLALFASDFFWLMTNPDFYPAAYIVPLLVLAGIVRIYIIFCNFGALYKDATGIMAQASWIKVVVATVGYLLLIPAYGVYGAAFILLLSNLVELFWVQSRSSRLYDMELRWRPVLVVLFVSSIFVAGGLVLPEQDVWYFGARVVIYLALLVAMYALPVWSREERGFIMTVVSSVPVKIRQRFAK